MKVMVSFQLGKLNVKDEIINNDTSVAQKKNKNIADPSSMQDARHIRTQLNGLALHEFS